MQGITVGANNIPAIKLYRKIGEIKFPQGLWKMLTYSWGFPGESVVKNLPASAGDLGSTPGSGRTPGEGNDNRLQYSCLGNPMDRGARCTTVHGVTKKLDMTQQLNNSNNLLTYSWESIRPCTCIGIWGCSVKTQEGPKFSPLVLFDVLCEQEVKAKTELSSA